MINKTSFESLIAASILRGRYKMGLPISSAEAFMRAKQVAAALPQLFEDKSP